MLRYYQFPKKVTRCFAKEHADHNRYLCQFRDWEKTYFVTDCAFRELDGALSYVSIVMRFVRTVAEGRIYDSKTQQILFTCQLSVPLPEPVEPPSIHEAPAQYAQLPITGLDQPISPKKVARQKQKVSETLAKLRLIHDELNAELRAHPSERPAIQSPLDAAHIMQCFLGNLDHEELWVINLDTRNRVMSLTQLYKGSVNASQVRIVEVFRQAIIDNSPAIIVAHNHPSGDISPSPEDVSVTRTLVQAGKLLEIDLLDHLVIGHSNYTSLKEKGLGF